MPFERRYISQSLCKYDRSLSRKSIRKARYFECLVFLFATDHRHIFALLSNKEISQKSCKEICIAYSKFVFFPNSRSVTLTERNTVYSTTNLSTRRHLTNQSMIPESGIMERQHQRHVSRLVALSPSPGHRWARFAP